MFGRIFDRVTLLEKEVAALTTKCERKDSELERKDRELEAADLKTRKHVLAADTLKRSYDVEVKRLADAHEQVGYI